MRTESVRGGEGPPAGRVWELPPRPGHLTRSLKVEETLVMGTWQWGHLGQQPEARGAAGGGRGVLGDKWGGAEGVRSCPLRTEQWGHWAGPHRQRSKNTPFHPQCSQQARREYLLDK